MPYTRPGLTHHHPAHQILRWAVCKGVKMEGCETKGGRGACEGETEGCVREFRESVKVRARRDGSLMGMGHGCSG